MARNTELVRQWEILRDIDGARNGIAVGKLAAERGVCGRTIPMWKLANRPFGRLEQTGLSLTELCALYFSRALLDTLAGSPLLDESERAFAKIERALPAACRRFLDTLPRVLQAKPDGLKQHDSRRMREVLARALDATLLHRRAEMRYASASSHRTKTYVVEAQRLVYAHGGIYLIAWVPEYGQLRTFAAERIETFAVGDERFDPRPLPTEPFADSLGVHTGPPERVVIEFEPDAAPFVRERRWHRSQRIEARPDGGIVLTLDVCNDHALRAWILCFGPLARVTEPVGLAQAIFDAAGQTRRRYMKLLRAHAPVLAMRAG
jgi:predicted DNA-binding transcriptional regulator YafY